MLRLGCRGRCDSVQRQELPGQQVMVANEVFIPPPLTCRSIVVEFAKEERRREPRHDDRG
jgi:hypothetical protein